MRLTIVKVEEQVLETGASTIMQVRPSYALVTAAPVSQSGYTAARDDEAEVWLVKDDKITLMDGDVKLKSFLFP